MGAVKKCIYPIAKNPFYLENAGIFVYSIEELAYVLYENIYLVDEELLGEELCLWMEKELGMTHLSEKLRAGWKGESHVYNQVMLILQTSGQYSEKEIQQLSEKIKEISSLKTQERMKYKADELAKNGGLWGAIAEYEKILSIRQSSRLEPEFYANVWNNLGYCYGKQFLFEKAAVCYENAWQFHKSDRYKERAHYARRLSQYGQQESEEVQETNLSDEFLKDGEKILKELEKKCFEELTDQDIEQLLKEQEIKYKK